MAPSRCSSGSSEGAGELSEASAGAAGAGSLAVVGTGIRFGIQTTDEARATIERADKVLYLFSDAVAGGWIEGLNPTAESLDRFYAPGKPRRETYREMVEEILAWLRRGLDVCVAFYGHPGVFASPAHEAVRRARMNGFPARILPGVSAEDCLFADLEVDPGDGCQSFEATDFLLYPRNVDTTVSLVLWQVAGVGERSGATAPNREGFRILAERLSALYGQDHQVVLYEASPYPIGDPWIQRTRLRDLPAAELAPMATLYVPPAGSPEPDWEMFDRLELPREPIS